MSTVEEIRREIMNLAPDQAEQLVRWLLHHVSAAKDPRFSQPTWLPGIESTPGICGGEPRILRTRIPVWTLEQMRRQGQTESEILQSYPTLRAEDLVHAWAYVALHREEINEQIRSNEANATSETVFGYTGRHVDPVTGGEVG